MRKRLRRQTLACARWIFQIHISAVFINDQRVRETSRTSPSHYVLPLSAERSQGRDSNLKLRKKIFGGIQKNKQSVLKSYSLEKNQGPSRKDWSGMQYQPSNIFPSEIFRTAARLSGPMFSQAYPFLYGNDFQGVAPVYLDDTPANPR